MQTLLDDAASWFLESLEYECEGEVRVIVIEGIRAETPEDLRVGEHVIEDVYAVEPSATSRRIVVRFSRPVAWQVVDESCTSFDESESRDDNCFLSTLTQSAYFRHVKAHHGWFTQVAGPASHYRLWTEREVIDVIAHDEPDVRPLDRT